MKLSRAQPHCSNGCLLFYPRTPVTNKKILSIYPFHPITSTLQLFTHLSFVKGHVPSFVCETDVSFLATFVGCARWVLNSPAARTIQGVQSDQSEEIRGLNKVRSCERKTLRWFSTFRWISTTYYETGNKQKKTVVMFHLQMNFTWRGLGKRIPPRLPQHILARTCHWDIDWDLRRSLCSFSAFPTFSQIKYQ